MIQYKSPQIPYLVGLHLGAFIIEKTVAVLAACSTYIRTELPVKRISQRYRYVSLICTFDLTERTYILAQALQYVKYSIVNHGIIEVTRRVRCNYGIN